MMGTKARIFGLLHDVSLEDLVPRESFYRHVEAKLDLSFVRDLVKDTYSAFGRPSIDPVVFFKLHLVMFFEGLRSERQLVQVAGDRLSVRWYLGYDLHELLPEHSSMTRIRDRYGILIFRRFFDTIVEQCRQVWCGARNCISMLPRSRQMPIGTRCYRASMWMQSTHILRSCLVPVPLLRQRIACLHQSLIHFHCPCRSISHHRFERIWLPLMLRAMTG